MAEPVEFPDWEFLHNNSDDPPLVDFPLINPDYFSLHPPLTNYSNSISTSETDPSDVDRNFDDSYVANQLFPAAEETYLMKEPSSSSSSSSTETTRTTAAVASELVLDDDSKKEEENRRVAWWKVPFEVFKYWVSPVVPLWSLSLTAAFLGLVILGRRLYKMKRKTQTLKLNVALDDDKKVSQLMGRVARLNEAFSVVRRVPIVRPSLPASSVTLRPVMSMR